MTSLRIGTLFTGIGGLDMGLHEAGHELRFFCENDPQARAVLSFHFPEVKIHSDIKSLTRHDQIDVITAGFPCQDISLAGTRRGLEGQRSGLVNEVFRITNKSRPRLIIIENVLNLLRLEGGKALISILRDLEKQNYSWAYRVVDSRGFSLPQRRHRVIIVASRSPDEAKRVLFSQNADPDYEDKMDRLRRNSDYGFYWTEGKRGVGWAKDAVPPIKGGSGLGIPSAPAVFSGRLQVAGTISIEDAERLQGFPENWTDVEGVGRSGNRWRLVGNAVSVPVSKWLGEQLRDIDSVKCPPIKAFEFGTPLPKAAFGSKGEWFGADISSHVKVSKHESLRSFLEHPLKPLSEKALRGYLSRAYAGDKKFPEGFLVALESQLRRQAKRQISPIYLKSHS